MNGLWDYVKKWREIFNDVRSLQWDKSWIKNDYCKDCRFCCGKQDSDTPFPMPLLPGQMRPGLKRDFHLLDSLTPYLGAAGCLSCTNSGCRLDSVQKPVACGLFPIVLVNGSLYLYENCPAVIFSPLIRFFELSQSVANMLAKLDITDLRRLSLWLTADILSRNYIDLRVKIFDSAGKNIMFD